MAYIIPGGFGYRSVPISPEVMAWMEMGMEGAAEAAGVLLVCPHCRTRVMGNNDPTDATMKVTCQCRQRVMQVSETSN